MAYFRTLPDLTFQCKKRSGYEIRRDWHRYEPADSDVNQYGGRLSGHLWFGIKCKLVLFSVIEK